jgi:pimeloyl-ACP methyl ester carboxylesterase
MIVGLVLAKSIESFDGVNIVYDVNGEEHADSGTVVFVHGWSCNRTHWVNQVQDFSSRYQTIAIDLAGHGGSALGRTDYSIPSFGLDVVTVLDHEHVDSAALVGHSMGGMVILHAARLLDDRVAGIVGADALKSLRNDPSTGMQATALEPLNRDYETVVGGIVSNMFAADTSDDLKKMITDGMVAIPQEVGIGAMRGMAEDIALFETVLALNVPKMAINATGRPLDEEAARDAGVDVRFVPTTGHFVMNEDSPAFNQLLDEALGRMFE